MTVMITTVSNDALNKRRQKARRRSLLRCKGSSRPTYKSAPGPASETPEPPIRMIVSDWCVDELGNRTRIIKRD